MQAARIKVHMCNTYHSVKKAMSQSDSVQIDTRSEEHQEVLQLFHHQPSSKSLHRIPPTHGSPMKRSFSDQLIASQT
jgi:hypothetical protein